ncbi:MAG: hypothetical protein NTZ59_15315, partial [Bacteroidetes bacterium]|nr:hypothetical protein [Bacteroidota bacterium]
MNEEAVLFIISQENKYNANIVRFNVKFIYYDHLKPFLSTYLIIKLLVVINPTVLQPTTKIKIMRIFITLGLLMLTTFSKAQSISGTLNDETNKPV